MNKNVSSFFSDHRSAIVSVVVVLVFILMAAVILNGVNRNTLRQRQVQVDSTRKAVDALIDERFSLAVEMFPALGELPVDSVSLSDSISEALASYRSSPDDASVVSEAYTQLDDALKVLQRDLISHPEFQTSDAGQRLVRCLNAMSQCEEKLVEAMADYEYAASQLRGRINSFPMNITAAREGIMVPAGFSIQRALQNRP